MRCCLFKIVYTFAGLKRLVVHSSVNEEKTVIILQISVILGKQGKKSLVAAVYDLCPSGSDLCRKNRRTYKTCHGGKQQCEKNSDASWIFGHAVPSFCSFIPDCFGWLPLKGYCLQDL